MRDFAMEHLRQHLYVRYFLPADGQFVFSLFCKDFDDEGFDILQAVDKKGIVLS